MPVTDEPIWKAFAWACSALDDCLLLLAAAALAAASHFYLNL